MLGGVGGYNQPPRFSKIFLLDNFWKRVGGDYSQSLFHFITKHTIYYYVSPIPYPPSPIYLKKLGQLQQLSYKKLKKNPRPLYNRICLKK